MYTNANSNEKICMKNYLDIFLISAYYKTIENRHTSGIDNENEYKTR